MYRRRRTATMALFMYPKTGYESYVPERPLLTETAIPLGGPVHAWPEPSSAGRSGRCAHTEDSDSQSIQSASDDLRVAAFGAPCPLHIVIEPDVSRRKSLRQTRQARSLKLYASGHYLKASCRQYSSNSQSRTCGVAKSLSTPRLCHAARP